MFEIIDRYAQSFKHTFSLQILGPYSCLETRACPHVLE